MRFSRHGHKAAKRPLLTEPATHFRSQPGRGLAIAICIVATAFAFLAAGHRTSAANILWVSDVGVPGTWSGPGAGFTDQGFVTLLQNAGHNVNRFNQSNNAGTVSMTVNEIAAINTNDLIIIGRAGNSPTYQNFRATNWNRDVIRPVIVMSPYFVRPDGNRLGWFTGGTLPDDVPSPLTPGNASDPTVDYIFGDVVMNGTNTAQLYDEPMDRNTSHIQNAPVAGAVPIATVTSPQEGSATVVTVNAIVGFPAGTAVRGGADILPAYRMYFSGGTREGATAPNTIHFYTGRENLTPVGENVFLRAVQVALNNGVAPTTHTGPVDIISQPGNLTVLRGQGATFFITVAGAAPRTLQWQRSVGDGSFTNIPGAVSTFPKSSYSLAAVDITDNGAQFQVVVANGLNSVTSSVATLTVSPDNLAPLPVSAASFDGAVITVCFNELINTATMNDPSAFAINGGGAILVNSITPGPDGRSLNLLLSEPMGTNATVDFFYIEDVFGNVSFSGPTITATNFGLSGVDVGTVNPAGSNFTCDTNSFQVSAGGLDIGSTADILRFVHKTVDGDFDARVRVTSFVGTNAQFESVAKAMLGARADNSAGSPAVNVWITPSGPGDNNVTASYRATAGGPTNTFGTTVTPSGLPNAWMRIQRAGDQFTTSRSLNGVDWVTLGTTSIVLPPALNVGVGVVSHRNGKVATATFTDFKISQGAVPPTPPTLGRFSYAGGQFSARFQTENGIVYIVEYKDDLNLVPWTTLTTVSGDGTVKSFTDAGPVSPTGSRFFRIRVQ